MSSIAATYADQGFVSGVAMLSEAEAQVHRSDMEAAEEVLGPLHYRDKIHTLLRSPYELCTLPGVLDVVEACIGPDILLYNSTFIIKEPGTEAHVAWHQDLTYWGLSDDDAQVSMWLALAPATEASGCMQFLPGSHRSGHVPHEFGTAAGDTKTNVLLQDQRITDLASAGFDSSDAVFCPLQPGEASFHHGWAMHSSPPNTSADRRIGLNVQFLAPRNATGQPGHTALLVRGVDEHGHYEADPVPTGEPPATLAPEVLQRWVALDERMKAGFKIAPDG